MDTASDSDVWRDDKLERKLVAEYLGNYLTNKFSVSKETSLHDSFVLNINAEWGFGKTYLLRNWADDLRSSGHPCIYFNAWSTDFAENPLIAFIAEIENQLTPLLDKPEKKLLKTAIYKGKKLVRPSVPLLLSILAKNLTGMSWQDFSEILEGTGGSENEEGGDVEKKSSTRQDVVATVVSKAAEEALKEHKNHQTYIKDFKASLSKLTERLDARLGNPKLPVFVFVDELDRCKPTYAIELLEQVKHLFGVRGVYFVVATDSVQLVHSIKAVYGIGFDAERYLRRFFDQEYTLPKPNNRAFASYLMRKFRLEKSEAFVTGLSENVYSDTDRVAEMFSQYSQFFGMSLRDQEQCCAILDAVRLTTPKGERLFLGYLLLLIMLRQVRREAFESYERAPSWDSIREAVAKNTDPSINFRSAALDAHDSFARSKPSTISMTQLIRHYLELANTSSEKLAEERVPNDQMFAELRRARLNYPSDGLTSYVSRVARAGQFGFNQR